MVMLKENAQDLRLPSRLFEGSNIELMGIFNTELMGNFH